VTFYAAGVVPILALTLGYRTRLATLLTFVFVHSVENRNVLLCDSGDTLVRMMLFWGLFTDLGGRFSLDVRLGRRPPARTTRATFVRFMHLQVALMYVCSVAAKTGPSWADGSAVGRALADPDFARPFGAWLVGVPLACRALTHLTLAVEGGFPALTLAPWAQPWATRIGILSGVALHAGILLTMRVGIFSVIVMATYITFMDTDLLDALSKPLPWLAAKGEIRVPWSGRLEWALAGVLAVHFAVIVRSLLPTVPAWAARETALAGNWQNWAMFSPDAPYASYRLFARGQDVLGQDVDPLLLAAPELLVQRRTWYQRWDKIRGSVAAARKRALGPLGRYVCHTYNRDASHPRLDEFRLLLDIEPVDAPGVPPNVKSRPAALFWTQKCGGHGHAPG
jgi:hypothetical protein